jgi:hypothetical protein
MGTVIQITETPSHGGNTCWLSTSKAFEALPPGIRTYLAGLTATPTWEVSGFRDALGRRGDEALVNAIRHFKPVSHPVVLVHPDSGRRCLYVNDSFTKHIDGCRAVRPGTTGAAGPCRAHCAAHRLRAVAADTRPAVRSFTHCCSCSDDSLAHRLWNASAASLVRRGAQSLAAIEPPCAI